MTVTLLAWTVVAAFALVGAGTVAMIARGLALTPEPRRVIAGKFAGRSDLALAPDVEEDVTRWSSWWMRESPR